MSSYVKSFGKSLARATGHEFVFENILNELESIYGGIHINTPPGAMRGRLDGVREELQNVALRDNEKSIKKRAILAKIHEGLVLLDNHDYEWNNRFEGGPRVDMYMTSIRPDFVEKNSKNGDTLRMGKLLLRMTTDKLDEFRQATELTAQQKERYGHQFRNRFPPVPILPPRRGGTRKQKRSQRKTRKSKAKRN